MGTMCGPFDGTKKYAAVIMRESREKTLWPPISRQGLISNNEMTVSRSRGDRKAGLHCRIIDELKKQNGKKAPLVLALFAQYNLYRLLAYYCLKASYLLLAKTETELCQLQQSFVFPDWLLN